MNYTGKGVGVAILDTGIFPHPDFDSRITVFNDFVNHKQPPYDDNSHGTHVAGVIAGNGKMSSGKYRGMAPGCHLVVCKVLDKKGNGSVVDVLTGLKWIQRNKEKYGIRIVNISVGSLNRSGMGEQSILVRGVDTAWDEGLIIVVAAGNEGPSPMTITTPGISRSVITVGCSDDHKMVDVGGVRMVNYSGRGPTEECIVKPDVVAPGCNIISCNVISKRDGSAYAGKSGTSMATPIVSGAIALLLEKYPYMTNLEVKLKLRDSTDDLGLSKNQQGWGLLNVEKLLR